MELSYGVAYLGGLLTFLAPCGAFLLPAFFAYAFNSKGTLLAKTGLFLFGLFCALLPLGMAAGSLAAQLVNHRQSIITVTAIFVVLMGIVQIFAIPLPKFSLPGLHKIQRPGESSALAVFLLGISYGLAGAGCTGPILGTILTTATITGSTLKGAIVMAWYALGIFTPILLLTLVWDGLGQGSRGWFRPRPLKVLGRDNTWGGLITGLFCLILGVWLWWSGGSQGFSLLNATEQTDLENQVVQRLNQVPNLLWVGLLLVLGLFIWALRQQLKAKRHRGADLTK